MKTKCLAQLFTFQFKKPIFTFSNKKKDFYGKYALILELLGVSKSASATEIKKAYYKMAQ